LWRCGVVALWRCGVVALWRCGVVALWRCGVVADPTLENGHSVKLDSIGANNVQNTQKIHA
jgi:hypothetical protein